VPYYNIIIFNCKNKNKLKIKKKKKTKTKTKTIFKKTVLMKYIKFKKIFIL
jgi:hypothetical protein